MDLPSSVFAIPPLFFLMTVLQHAATRHNQPFPLVKVAIFTIFGGFVSLILASLFHKDPEPPRIYVGYFHKEHFLDYWQANDFHFDHPEPNFTILPHIAEFWSAVTTIPLSGMQ